MPALNPLPFLCSVAKSIAAQFPFLRKAADTPGRPRAQSKGEARRWSAELLKQLEWRRFEEFCAAYYETEGFTTKVSAAGAIGGVNIALHEKGSQGAQALARCKGWDAYRVGVKAVKELRAAMAAEGIGQGVLLTSGRFTHEAAALARAENIDLVDGAALLDKLAALPPEKAAGLLKFATQGDFVTPTCPTCSIKMTSRQSTGEGRRFWGCRNYPACKQTFAGTPHAPA
jgi:restriction system protein